VNALDEAGREFKDQQEQAKVALESASKAGAESRVADEQLQRCDLLERALDVLTANRQVQDAQISLDKEVALRARLETASREQVVLSERRSAITVPPHAAVGAMRKLSRELDAALAALDVGFVVTVKPKVNVDIQVRKDSARRLRIHFRYPERGLEQDGYRRRSVAKLVICVAPFSINLVFSRL